MRQVILYTDEEGIWIGEVSSLPGYGSDGKTREEALDNSGNLSPSLRRELRVIWPT